MNCLTFSEGYFQLLESVLGLPLVTTGNIWIQTIVDFDQTLSFLNFGPREDPDFIFVASD